MPKQTGSRVLLLSPHPETIQQTILATGDTIIAANDANAINQPADIVICYGYRHILRRAFLQGLGRPPINLHISYLPWNRGSDPNIWSWIDDTPRGVTIHEIDEGVDTGDIIAQEIVSFGPNETLKTSYWGLRRAVEGLFASHWPAIRERSYIARKQIGKGTSHKCADKNAYLLPDGFDTPVALLSMSAAENQMSEQFSRRWRAEVTALGCDPKINRNDR